MISAHELKQSITPSIGPGINFGTLTLNMIPDFNLFFDDTGAAVGAAPQIRNRAQSRNQAPVSEPGQRRHDAPSSSIKAFATVSACSGEMTATKAIINTASPQKSLFRPSFRRIVLYRQAKA